MPHASKLIYDLSFAAHGQHLVDVVVHLPEAAGTTDATTGAWSVDVAMPVWTPGSYMVREFARNVQDVRASSATKETTADVGAAAAAADSITVHKVDKCTWRVTAATPQAVRVAYRVWGRELTVRSTCIEQDFALLQGAATYLSPAAASAWPHEVRLRLPPAYTQVVCGLPVQEAGGGHRIVAQSFDELVDTPIALGNPDLQHFEVRGVPHTLATFGDIGLFDCAQAATDFSAIASQTAEMFGGVPYERYAMINLLYGGQGGLEHRHSAVIMASPYAARNKEVYRSFLGLVAHEHFHAWNIKRLRPEALGPFDYRQENYTESLWVAEGLTAFYDNLMVLRAGLCDSKQYLTALSQDMARLHNTQGRHKQSLAQASFDAWIKFYRRDENTDNTAVSYYLKGALVGVLLNAEIVRLTGQHKSLDDVMRLAYERHSGAHGFSEKAFRACAFDVCPELDKDFFARLVDGTTELDDAMLCRTFGITKQASGKAPGAEPSGVGSAPSIALGMQIKEVDGRLMVTQVQVGSAASQACLQADDEIIAIGGRRMSQATLGYLLQMARPGQALQLLFCRYGAVKQAALTPLPAPDPHRPWLWHKEPDAAQRDARRLWLGSQAD